MRMSVRLIIAILVIVFGGSAGLAVWQASGRPQFEDSRVEQVFREAASLGAEGSWQLALERLRELEDESLDEETRRWLRLYRADALWRSVVSDRIEDPTELNQARRELQELIGERPSEEDHDRVWAEANESLGDSYLRTPRTIDWREAFEHYARALDWWSRSRDIDTARKKYLGIVWKLSDEEQEFRHYGSSLPREILENAVKIARTPEDRARASYLLARRMAAEANPREMERIATLFSDALAGGRQSDYYDDALFHRGQWLERSGKLVQAPDGSWRQTADLEGALESYRRLVQEFAPGTSRWRDTARQRIEAITEPSLNVAVSNVFLPGSRIEFHLGTRNLSSVTFNLWKVDLTRDVRSIEGRGWLESIETANATSISVWNRSIEPSQPHAPVSEKVRLERELPVGAYVLEASAGAVRSRELILVTDIALVLRSGSNGMVAFATDARTGEPIAGARVMTLIDRRSNRERERMLRGTTDADGVSRIEDPSIQGWRTTFTAVASGDRQAFATSSFWTRTSEAPAWRIYAETDRPAYRPQDVVRWKITVRSLVDEVYSTPAGEKVNYRIMDPRHTQVAEGELTLNEFGSAWGELALDESAALGMYGVEFYGDPSFKLLVGSAQLFRVEEYKLPEFRVSVTPLPADDGEAPGPGDRLSAAIDVEYYFGGPVRDASVEVVVHERPFHVWWSPRHRYAWYHAESIMPPHWGRGQEIWRGSVITDDDGRAVIEFEIPRNVTSAEYEIEARVVDSSRREVIGSGSVRISSSPFFAQLRGEHHLYRPGASATVELETKDANNRPVATEGRLTITREEWREVWLDPSGRRIEGAALDAARRSHPVFPPPVDDDRHGWKLVHRGYDREEIATVDLSTDRDGRGEYTFTPRSEGFYRLSWNGHLAGTRAVTPRDTVTAETTIWVTSDSSARLGYHPGGLEIIVDPGEFRTGSIARALVVAPVSGHHILFTVETDAILEHRVFEMKGTAEMVEIPVDERHVPNFFVSAVSVRDLQAHADVEEIVVPPVERFLDVEVVADAETYLPGAEGTIAISTKDHDGRPVAAELSLGVSDESVFYIQRELSADPREFFYGTKRHAGVQMTTSFQGKPYALVTGEQDDAALAREEKAESGAVAGVTGGFVQQRAVAEEITVTASAPAVAAPPPPPSVAPSAADADAGSGEVRVRSDFRATAFWQPDVRTGTDGKATVRFTYPDTLTSWRATARAVTRGNEFGIGSTSVRTTQPLTVRLQAPRFFVVGDESTVSAVIGNGTDANVTVSPAIEAEGLEVKVATDAAQVTLAPGEQQVVEWTVSAGTAGVARISVSASGSGVGDAMVRSIPVYEHGIEKLIAASGKMRGDSATIELNLPEARRTGSTVMEVTLAPSIAVTMLDALPYLIEFPYGCTEQTMSRFLPAAIVGRTLANLGVDRSIVAQRLLGGIEREVADDRADRAEQLARLDAVTSTGLARLYDMQKPDGSWGWWKEGDSDPWMTAYVLWGYSLARDAGISVRSDSYQRAVGWTSTALVEAEGRPELHAWMLHALTSAEPRAGAHAEQAFRHLYERREKLSSYARALLALSAHHLGHSAEAAVLVRNLENAAQRDESTDRSVIAAVDGGTSDARMDTVHWGSGSGHWWRWFDSPVESTAFVLRALVTIDPDHRLIEPAMNWLVRNRRGAQWSNTRDTAIAVLALDEYLRGSGEIASSGTWAIDVNGEDLGTRTFSPADVLAAPARIRIPSAYVRDGVNRIRLRRTGGDSPLYFAAEARFFSEEEPVTAAGNELFVRRDYYRIVPRPTLLAGFVEDRVPLRDGESIASGERVEVVVTVETKNDYEYLMFEDMKPAGFEAVEVRSGEHLMARRLSSLAVDRRFVEESGTESRPRGEDLRVRRPSGADTIDSRYVHQELRDRKVALFADKLPQGVWEIRYTLRAEVPGRYHALPLIGQAMYVPEIRANGEEVRVVVEDGEGE